MPRELMVLFSLMCLHIVWVLLPLVPSILIYRLFPNTAVAVSGPLMNLSVRASGAFAAYLIVFAITYPLVQTTKDAIGGFQRQFWTLNGQIKLVNADGKEMHSQTLLKKIAVQTNPVSYIIESYYFKLRIMQTDEEEFPLVIINIPSFGEQVINLKTISAATNVDNYHKTIEIKEPIIIQEFLNKNIPGVPHEQPMDDRSPARPDQPPG